MTKSVLDEYIPLIIPSITMAFDPSWEYGLNYSHFEWCLRSDIKKGGDYSQTFEAGQSLELLGYEGLYDTTALDPNRIDLGGKPFRLPDVSFAFGDKTLILSDKAAAGISLSKKLATTTGTANLMDPFGTRHSGFHYISFLNPLPAEQAAIRLQKLPIEERLFAYIALDEYSELVLVHKSLCSRWTELGIDCFLSELPEIYHDLENYNCDEIQFANHEVTFESLDDWQNNVFTYDSY